MKKIIFFLLFGSSAYAATPLGGTISAPNSTGSGGGSNTTVSAGSGIIITTNSPTSVTISTNGGGGGISTPVSVANGGTSSSTATAANRTIGIYPFFNALGYNTYSFFNIAPSFSGQFGLYYPNSVAQLFLSSSTSTGDWIGHGMGFPGGLNSIGDPNFEDPNIANVYIYQNGSPTTWTATGDATVVVKNMSPLGSGSGFTTAVMDTGSGAKTISIVVGGSGYALGDVINLTGGTVLVGPRFGGVVAALSGSSVSSIKIFENGEYKTIPTGTISTTTSGAGSGCTVTLTWGTKAITALADNSSSYVHPNQASGASLGAGLSYFVGTEDNTYNRGWGVCFPSISGIDNGNWFMQINDAEHKLFRIPHWTTTGVYQPDDSGYTDSFTVNPATGTTTALSIIATNITVLGTATLPTVNLNTLNVETINLSNALNVASGGTGSSNWPANTVAVYNGTNIPTKVVVQGNGFDVSTGSLLYTNINYSINTNLFLPTNAVTTNILTIAVPTNSQMIASYSINEAGKTNYASFAQSTAVIRGTASGAVIVYTNSLVTNYTKASLQSNYWTISGNNATLNITGMTNEPINAHVLGNYYIDTNGVPPPIVACNDWMYQTSFNQNVAGTVVGNGYPCEQLTLATATNFCHIQVLVGNGGGNTYNIEFWSTALRTGTQYGTTQSFLANGSGFDDPYDVVFSSQINVPAGVFYVYVFPTSTSATYNIGAHDGDPFPTGVAYQGGVPIIGWDLYFILSSNF